MMHAAVPLLLEAALRAFLAACALGAGLRLLRVTNVPAQKAAWGLVLMAALAMPLLIRLPWLPTWAAIKLPVPAWPHGLRTASGASSDSTPVRPQVATDRFSAPTISVMPFDVPHNEASVDSSASELETDPDRSQILAAVPAGAAAMRRTPVRLFDIAWLAYLGVTAALLFRLLVGLSSSLRVWLQAEPVEIAPDGIRVRSSRRVASPVNIGSGILLPADYVQWDEEKLRVVLAHERSHVRQRDFYLQLLAGFYAAFTWFSPLGWWLKSKLSELGEAISDRAGLEAAASPSAYAQLLLEFAARPRPNLSGVAMAHSNRLSQRIERLLNDESFRQAFTGKRRVLFAVVAAPLALMAATALVRVQAAEVIAHPAIVMDAAASLEQQPAAQTPMQSPSASARSGQSHPDEGEVTQEAPTAPGSSQAPSAPQVTPAPQPAPKAAPAENAEPDAMPIPTLPPIPQVSVIVPMPPMPALHVEVPAPLIAEARHYAYYSSFGDTYAMVGDPGARIRYAGDWDGDREADVEKARSLAHGHFLIFRHEGKTYFIDDPAIVSQIEAMQKPMDDLSAQMKDLGKQMRAAGEQAREEARKAHEISQNISAPDLSKEMADLNAAVAALKNEQNGTITRQQLSEIEHKVEEVQRKVINAQVKVDVSWGREMGAFGKAQGEFGEKMGKLGAQMGQLARENNGKIQSIIDESLKNGKARPVQ